MLPFAAPLFPFPVYQKQFYAPPLKLFTWPSDALLSCSAIHLATNHSLVRPTCSSEISMLRSISSVGKGVDERGGVGAGAIEACCSGFFTAWLIVWSGRRWASREDVGDGEGVRGLGGGGVGGGGGRRVVLAASVHCCHKRS